MKTPTAIPVAAVYDRRGRPGTETAVIDRRYSCRCRTGGGALIWIVATGVGSQVGRVIPNAPDLLSERRLEDKPPYPRSAWQQTALRRSSQNQICVPYGISGEPVQLLHANPFPLHG